MLTVVAFVALLGILITVHEAGHFFVAKACGVRVLTFSIGFGPRLVGFRRGETEYRISALPLGGYVKMYGDDIEEEIPPEELHRSFLGQPFLKKSAIAVAGPLANILLPVALLFGLNVGHETVPAAVAGTVIDGEPAAQGGLRSGDRIVAVGGTPVTLFSDLQAFVEPRPGVPLRLTVERAGKTFDLEVTPRAARDPTIFDRKRTVGRLGILAGVELPTVLVEPDSPAAAAGIRDRDRVTAVDGTPVQSKDELMAALDAAAAAGTATVEVVHDGAAAGKAGGAAPAAGADDGAHDGEHEDDDAVAPAAAAPDGKPRTVTLTAEEAAPVEIAVDRFGVTGDELSTDPVSGRVAQTLASTRAAQADAARRFGLSPVDGLVAHVEPRTVAAEKGLVAGDRIVAVDGKKLVTPQDLQAPLNADPDGIHVVGVTGAGGARVLAFRMLPAPQRQMGGLKVFGVALSSSMGDGPMVERTVSPVEAARRAVDQTGDLVLDVFRGFAMLVTGGVGLQALSGPIGIAKLSGQAAELGAASYVSIMGLISVNLAVMNMIPIPVLDGGHLMFFVIELVTRKKISGETRRKAVLVGLVLIGILMVVALTNDVLGLFSP